MPPRKYSRYTFSLAFEDTNNALQLTERQPYAYREFSDNVQHEVKEGETLGSLAARYFRGIDNAAKLWWVIADFQPEPIHDPTLRIDLGRVLVIPSVRTLTEFVFAENRRFESEQ